jgi:hypothetical protein
MVKRFKNGNIHLDARKEIKEGVYTTKDWRIHLEGSMYYRNQMTVKNIYLWSYLNNLYVADTETGLFYKTFYNDTDIFLSNIIKKQRIILKPLPIKECKELQEFFMKEF